MKIEVRGLGMELSPSIKAYAASRVHFALDRTLNSAATIRLRLADLNGPKGGVDKQCKLEVLGVPPNARVAVVHEDVFAAIDDACSRMAEVLRRRRRRPRGPSLSFGRA